MNTSTLGLIFALIITVGIACWAIFTTLLRPKSNPEKDVENYFTGRLGGARLFFNIFATTFSAFTVVGLPALFYSEGVGAFAFMAVGIILTPLVLHLIGKKIVNLSLDQDGHSSAIGLIAGGYKSNALTLVLSVVTISVLFPYLTLQIAGIGKFILSISDGKFLYSFGTTFTCLVVMSYIILGGAEADAETDLVQGPILIIGTFILGLYILLNLNGEFVETLSTLEQMGLTTIPGPNEYFTWPVLISFGVIFTLISISTPQVSQRIIGAKSPRHLNPLIKYYAIAGLIVIFLAGLIGLYAAANLQIASPDFVAGDVLRHLGSEGNTVLFVISILFMAGVLSAAISTIDSLLLSISGIASDNFKQFNPAENRRKFRGLSVAILGTGLLFSMNPPVYIVDLAKIQLAGLTALLPCLIGPLFGFNTKLSGWLALVFGLFPIILGRITVFQFWGFDAGVFGLMAGFLGLLLGCITFNHDR